MMINSASEFEPLPISFQDLNSAYHCLCQQRKHFPANADIWSFRYHWVQLREKLLQVVNTGHYRFSPIKRLSKANGQVIHLWSSQDALVMKVLASYLSTHLKQSGTCTHLKGHGGLKYSVTQIQSHLKHFNFVCKTDVKHFYESIDQIILMEQVYEQVDNPIVQRYLWQVIRRTVESGGLYQEIVQGISRGSSLSPILGALYLQTIDKQFEAQDLFYLRYMDDLIILTKTRWQNRRAVKTLNQCFEQLKISKHPDKTFIGKIDRGFDFLGYHFSRKPLCLAINTLRRHVEHLHRLYEQQKKKNATSREIVFVLDEYVKRWQRWCTAGLQGAIFEFYGDLQQIPIDLST